MRTRIAIIAGFVLTIAGCSSLLSLDNLHLADSSGGSDGGAAGDGNPDKDTGPNPGKEGGTDGGLPYCKLDDPGTAGKLDQCLLQ